MLLYRGPECVMRHDTTLHYLGNLYGSAPAFSAPVDKRRRVEGNTNPMQPKE